MNNINIELILKFTIVFLFITICILLFKRYLYHMNIKILSKNFYSNNDNDNYNNDNDNDNNDNKKPDKIYVINLDKNKDRWEFISNAGKNAGLDLERFPAVYGKDINNNDHRLDKYFVGGKDNKLTDGQIGCALSHIEIWNDAINNDYEKILVFEDDANIPENFWEQYNKVVVELPNDWDMLLLGGVYLGGRKYSNNLLIPDSRSGNWGTHAMLINIDFAKKIINEINENKVNTPIDNYLRDKYYYNNNYKVFIVSKTIVPINYKFISDIGVGYFGKNYEVKIYDNFESSDNSNSKKIALCFLIYEEIYHENLWYKWLENVDKSKYNIYIHYKNNKPLNHFEEYKLKNVRNDTCWGCLSIVLAQNLLLHEALKDNANQHFIWLSDSCIPLKSFDYVYNNLVEDRSYYNIAPNKQVFPRGDNILLQSPIKKENIKKAAMPSIICRNHAKLFVDNDKNISKWFKNINNVDEIVYITLLHYYGKQNELILTENIAAGAIIFAQWEDMVNFKKFELSKYEKHTPTSYNYICDEELDYLIKSNSMFGRKFLNGCGGLEKLIDKLV